MKVLIGPPIGLNLRNIVWHGFISDNEFEDFYTTFFFLVMITLAAQVNIVINQQLKKRNFVRLDNYPIEYYDFGMGPLVFSHPITQLELQCIYQLIERSFFVLPLRQHIVKDAFKRVYETNDMSALPRTEEEKLRYHRSLVLLLPQLEHSLRRVFVAVNQLPDCFLRAESRQYFTTWDILLANEIEVDDRGTLAKNRLKDELGSGIMNAFWDLFIHHAGPRPRDRISHCECDPYSIPYALVDRIFGLFVTLLMRYDCAHNVTDSLKYLSTLPYALQRCYHYFENYVSCFHPKSLLQRQLKQCLGSWNKIKEIVDQYPYRQYPQQQQQLQQLQQQERGDEEYEQTLYQYKRNDNSELTLRLQHLITTLDSIVRKNFNGSPSMFNLNESTAPSLSHPLLSDKLYPFETLICSPAELAKISVLRSITKELEHIIIELSTKVNSFMVIITERNTSRRTRDSFYKLLGCLDNIFLISTLLLRLVEAEFSNDNQLGTNSNKNNIFSNDEGKMVKETQKRLKLLNRTLSFLQRMKGKVCDNMWVSILEECLELLPAIEKIYCQGNK